MKQRGFVQFIVLGIVVLAIVSAGAFYLGKQTSKSAQPPASTQRGEQNQVITSQATPFPADLNGFPIYPGAKFAKKEITPPCTGDESGFTLCGSIIYTWTSDQADKVFAYYKEDQSNSGWKLQGGAGDFTDARNYSGKITLKKDNLVYDLYWYASENKVEFTLRIPNK